MEGWRLLLYFKVHRGGLNITIFDQQHLDFLLTANFLVLGHRKLRSRSRSEVSEYGSSNRSGYLNFNSSLTIILRKASKVLMLSQ